MKKLTARESSALGLLLIMAMILSACSGSTGSAIPSEKPEGIPKATGKASQEAKTASSDETHIKRSPVFPPPFMDPSQKEANITPEELVQGATEAFHQVKSFVYSYAEIQDIRREKEEKAPVIGLQKIWKVKKEPFAYQLNIRRTFNENVVEENQIAWDSAMAEEGQQNLKKQIPDPKEVLALLAENPEKFWVREHGDLYEAWCETNSINPQNLILPQLKYPVEKDSYGYHYQTLKQRIIYRFDKKTLLLVEKEWKIEGEFPAMASKNRPMETLQRSGSEKYSDFNEAEKQFDANHPVDSQWTFDQGGLQRTRILSQREIALEEVGFLPEVQEKLKALKKEGIPVKAQEILWEGQVPVMPVMDNGMGDEFLGVTMAITPRSFYVYREDTGEILEGESIINTAQVYSIPNWTIGMASCAISNNIFADRRKITFVVQYGFVGTGPAGERRMFGRQKLGLEDSGFQPADVSVTVESPVE